MAPRANWKGHLKLSLVSFAVRVYNATTSTSRVTLNQLHKDCNRRLKQKMVCPEHGDVERDDVVKGYEFEKGRYVVVEPDDLEKIRLETTKTIEITQFVDRAELRPIYLSAPYYVAPDGPVAEEAFRVIREAIKASGKVGIGRFVIGGREHVVSLEAEENGLLMTTLRSDAEVRGSEAYFEDVRDAGVEKGQLELARQLVEASAAPLDTGAFKDRYQEALLGVIKAKLEGREEDVIDEEDAPPTLNFMDALKASVAQSPAPTKRAAKTAAKTAVKKKPPAKSVKKKAPKKKKA